MVTASAEPVVHSLALRPVAAVAATGALCTLLVGGTILAAPISREVPAWGWPAVLACLGPAALAALSLFDMFTVPALHQKLAARGPALIMVATGTALTGDLMGVVGRLTHVAAVMSLSLGGHDDRTEVLQLLQTTLNTGGFLLVAVSFTTFGILFTRDGHRRLGIVAILAGTLTAAGQLPDLDVLFYVANLAFVAWYAALIAIFRTGPRALLSAARGRPSGPQ